MLAPRPKVQRVGDGRPDHSAERRWRLSEGDVVLLLSPLQLHHHRHNLTNNVSELR
jgi:hypothetical protein